MQVINDTTAKAYGQRAAMVALDQGEEFGSVQATIDAYRDNIVDTFTDEGIAQWAWVAVCAYDDAIAQRSEHTGA